MKTETAETIVILGTGGTIAGLAPDPSNNIDYVAAQVGVESLLSGVSGFQQLLAGRRYVAEQVAQIDSKDMDFEVWRRLALRAHHHLLQPQVRGVVITHGTDTVEESAFFLSRVLPSALLAQKPVVLTCAMRPASALSPDGPRNLLDALTLALDGQACGVTVVCAGVVHAARHVQKVHPYRLDAFDSGDAGPLAFIEEGRVRSVNNGFVDHAPMMNNAIEKIANRAALPRVEIVLSHAGAQGELVNALLHELASQVDPLRGLVVAATGNGSVSRSLESALCRAAALGVAVVRSTRCPYGQVISAGEARFPDSQGLSPVKARIDLMLQLL